MMRALWQVYVPGKAWALGYWGAVFVLEVLVGLFTDLIGDAWPLVLPVPFLLFLLNLASWDYQRRHGAGGAA